MRPRVRLHLGVAQIQSRIIERRFDTHDAQHRVEYMLMPHTHRLVIAHLFHSLPEMRVERLKLREAMMKKATWQTLDL